MKFLSAADIEKYGYCPLSWWLSRGERKEEEEERADLKDGEKRHRKIGAKVSEIKIVEKQSKEYETLVLWFGTVATIMAIIGLSFLGIIPSELRMSLIFMVIALIWLLVACYFLYRASMTKNGSQLRYNQLVVIFAMAAIVIGIFGLTLLDVNTLLGGILETVALIWLIGADFFLYRSLIYHERGKTIRKQLKIMGEIIYVDNVKKKPKLLVSKNHMLRGRPDYVLESGKEVIPVEVKTGRVPRGPLFSHILQIAAYCLLLRENGYNAHYGLLKYGDVEHEIEYTDELEKILLSKLQEMQNAIRSEDVHRNHTRPGKCRNCSRRDRCPEALD